MSYEKTITINARGNTLDALNEAIDEAVKLIKDGNHSGSNENNEGAFNFDSELNVVEMAEGDIGDEAKKMAAAFILGTGLSQFDTIDDLKVFSEQVLDVSLEGFIADSEYSIASAMQVMIDVLGGSDRDGDLELAEKLAKFWDDEFGVDISAIKDCVVRAPKMA